MGESLCIDETAPSNGELYTVVTNRAPRGGKGTIIAIIKGVSAGKVDKSRFKSFNVISATLYEHYDEILNFFVNRATNAFA